jgi:hypothetical protein
MMVVRPDSDDPPTASAAGDDRAHGEPVTMAAIHSLEQHLAGLATQMDRVEETVRFTQRSLEDSIRRSEGIAAEWLQEISTSMSVRFAEAEETIQRVERMVSGRETNHVVGLPWMVRLAVLVLALVTAAAIGALIMSSRVTAP